MFKRYLYRALYWPARLYWRIFHPTGYGVKVLVERKGLFLMVRHTYGKRRWTFPGGGIKKHETPVEAAVREVAEEVGLNINNLKQIGEFECTNEGKRDHVSAFAAKSDSDKFSIQPSEILEAGWFSKASLPKTISETGRKVLELYFSHQN